MHYYYVVYSYGSSLGSWSGFGSCQIAYGKKIESIDDVNELRKYISDKWCEGHTVLILNWKPIKKSKKISGDVNDGE